MEELMQRRKRFLISFAYIAVCVAIFYVFFRYIIYMAFPFVFAVIVTLCLKRPVEFFANKLHMPRKGASIVVLILFYLIVALIVVGIVVGASTAIIRWVGDIPQLYVDHIQPAVVSLVEFGQEKIDLLNSDYADYVRTIGTEIISGLYTAVSGISARLVLMAQGLALGVPKTLIGTVFSIVATIFLTIDWPTISYFILSQFGEKGKKIISESKLYVGQTIGHIIKSYALIMFVTFCELSIGLTILGVNSSVFYAFLIAIFDIIPALGTGGIVIPWVVIEIIYQDWKMAIGLAIMYVVITVIRNYIEPKIVGQSIGLHPVLILLSMYLGVKIFGVLGIIIMPFSLIVIKKLNDTGRIHLFKSSYKVDEQEEKDEQDA